MKFETKRPNRRAIGGGYAGIPKSFMITLSPEQAKFIYQWMQAEGTTSPQDAIRSLVQEKLAANPEQGAEQARALRAYYETRRWVTERVVADFKATLELLELSLKGDS